MAGQHRIEIQTDDTGPIVAKIALDPRSAAALEVEAARLERARHPGVVELIDRTEPPDAQLRYRWAGDATLDTEPIEVDEGLAIVASVAATLADLHRLGIVHGRIDASHVLLDADGSARLTGFGPGPDADDHALATPADDVAALGRLLHLVAAGPPDLEPIPDRRWAWRRPGSGPRRGALNLADHATDPDPAVRPTARTLAAGIAALVPGGVPHRTRAASVPHPDLPHPPACDPEPDASHRPPGPTDVAPLHEPATAPRDEQVPVADTVPSPSPLVIAETAPTDPPTSTIPAERPGDHDHADPAEEHDQSPTPVEPTETGRFLGLRVNEAGQAPPARHARPPHRTAAAGRPRRPATLLAGAAAALLVVGALVVISPPGRSHRPSSTTARHQQAPPSTAAPASPSPASLASTTRPTSRGEAPRCPAARGRGPDVDGDGCGDEVVIGPGTIRAAGVTYRLARPDDRVFVADWNCDGRATPALIRPATGDVFVFDAWPGDGPLTVARAARVRGARRLEVDTSAPAGCTIRVQAPDGAVTLGGPER